MTCGGSGVVKCSHHLLAMALPAGQAPPAFILPCLRVLLMVCLRGTGTALLSSSCTRVQAEHKTESDVSYVEGGLMLNIVSNIMSSNDLCESQGLAAFVGSL